ncbi:FAD-binding protein [uncultured Agitococcus sp.]|uniref:FAD-binding protein n=1 Tax=uncultured Agitococcus sp. TaxID=1506599 RepID=UPI00345C3F41
MLHTTARRVRSGKQHDDLRATRSQGADTRPDDAGRLHRRILGAGVGATRAVVDAGWCDHTLQIGQTGLYRLLPSLARIVEFAQALRHAQQCQRRQAREQAQHQQRIKL